MASGKGRVEKYKNELNIVNPILMMEKEVDLKRHSDFWLVGSLHEGGMNG